VLEFDIYPGRANLVALTLLNNNVPLVDHASITRVVIYVGSTIYDSATLPALFDLTKATHIEFKPGSAAPSLNEGTYECKLVIYDALDYQAGYVWPEHFTINVLSED
jgi:hypothetical protein